MSGPDHLGGTTDNEQRVLAGVARQLLIGGEWLPASSGRTLVVEDPATARPLAEVADGSAVDALAALDAASAAQPAWADTPPRQRGEILRRAFEAMIARSDELALLMTLEMGKPLAESAGEVAYAAEFFRWFSEEAVRVDGRYSVAPAGGSRLVVMRQPVGPCLLITPWNFPLAMATRKIGPAVAAGCTMVLKPAELTPLSALALAQILTDAGLPPGVLNVVCTSDPGGTTGPLLEDPRLRKLSFTGSTAVGSTLASQAARRLVRLSLELGGNAPFLVFADADLDAAVDGAMLAKMRNMGEACTSANRFYVHESLVADFARRLSARMEAMRVGRGTDPGVSVGPLVSRQQRDKVASLVGEAVGDGARPLIGGGPSQGLPAELAGGHFFDPTVLSEVPVGARLLSEEIFGPVAPIVSFHDDAEAIAAANDTPFGLIAYAFTASLDRAVMVMESLEAGMVGLNQGLVSNPAAPFGGVKQSGYGREGGREGIDEYLETKYVAIKVT